MNVSKATTSTATSPLNSSVVVGTTNTDKVTVTGNADGGSPTGTVSFYECGPTGVATACTSTANPVGGPVNVTAAAGNTATATSATFKATSTGYWCFAGVYSGDSDYSSSSDTTIDECYDVTRAPTTTTTTPTHTSIVLGATDTDAVTVTGTTTPGNPTGTVTFYECGPTAVATACTSTAHQVGGVMALTAGPGATSTATSASFSPTSAGYWCFAGVYSGDGNYSGSTDTTTDECVDVTQATSSTTTVPTTVSISLGTSGYRWRHGDGQSRRRQPDRVGVLLRVWAYGQPHRLYLQGQPGGSGGNADGRGGGRGHGDLTDLHADIGRVLVLRRGLLGGQQLPVELRWHHRRVHPCHTVDIIDRHLSDQPHDHTRPGRYRSGHGDR